jgi:hypothetical protein
MTNFTVLLRVGLTRCFIIKLNQLVFNVEFFLHTVKYLALKDLIVYKDIIISSPQIVV